MNRRLACPAVAALALLAGCHRRGVHVEAPGVHVEVDRGGRTVVEAPGTRVQAGPDGVAVQAPDTQVNVDR